MTLFQRHRSPIPRFAWAIVLLASTTWVGCSDQSFETPTSPGTALLAAGRSGSPVALGPQELGPALAAQGRHGARLMATPGVVGHGVALVNGEPSVRVFVQAPGVQGIPTDLDGVPVAVEVTGMFVAGDLGSPTTRERPAPNGFSIGHPAVTAGTLGAIVSDPSGLCYALSNNHVLANSNGANVGDNSLQPGPYDGGQDPTDAIGTLADFKTIAFNGGTNDIDAAISLLNSASSVTAATPSYAYGVPGTQPVAATVGLGVRKFGRTTGLTFGTVSEINVTADICYECSGPFCMRCKSAARFEGQFATTDMSDGGDSGSLIVDGKGDPVGLLFAGSTTRTIANDIADVLFHFEVGIEQDMANCTNGASGPTNTPPTVSISSPSAGSTFDQGTAITFQATASDSQDGNVTPGIAWTSDKDGSLGTGGSVSTTLSVNTHTITASVTDNGGLSDDDQITVVVNATSGGDFTLSAFGYKVRGYQAADLTWSGALSVNVDIIRDGSTIATVLDGGTYTDEIPRRGGGSYDYQVCEAGSQVCSNIATVVF